MNALIIDDELEICQLVESTCELNQITPTILTNPSSIKELDIHQYNLLFLDLNMPGLDGIEVMNYLASKKFTGDIILMSGFDNWLLNSAIAVAKSLNLNFHSSLEKPFRLASIESAIKQLKDAETLPSSERSASVTPTLSVEEIRSAIEKKKVRVLYQPQVDLMTKTIIGFEALVRIESDNGHFISPHLFLKTAIRERLIKNLSKIIIKTAFRDFCYLSEKFGYFTIAINLSGQDISDPELPDWTADLAAKNNISSSAIIFELNDLTVSNITPIQLQVIARLRLKGFKISLDDFGNNHSGFLDLKVLPITELKIHHQMTQDILISEKTRLLVKSLSKLSDELGVHLMISGIENQETEKLLKSIGCSLGQGFLYGQPMTARETLNFLNENTEVANGSIIETEESQNNRLLKSSNQKQNEQEAQYDADKYYIPLIAPLSGILSFIGKSQEYGYKKAFLDYPDLDVNPYIINDNSSLISSLEAIQTKIPPKALSLLGGAFPFQKTPIFSQAIQYSETPLFSPFNGCSMLHEAQHQACFHIKPSFKDEIEHLAFQRLKLIEKVAFVYPKNQLQNEYRNVIQQKPNWHFFPYQSSETEDIIHAIKAHHLTHVVIIGSAKGVMNLIHSINISDIEFFTISLAGIDFLEKFMLRETEVKLTITQPFPNKSNQTIISKKFDEHAQSASEEESPLINSISYESFATTHILLKLIEKFEITSKEQLKKAITGLQGDHYGLGETLSWSDKGRKLIHKVHEIEL